MTSTHSDVDTLGNLRLMSRNSSKKFELDKIPATVQESRTHGDKLILYVRCPNSL